MLRRISNLAKMGLLYRGSQLCFFATDTLRLQVEFSLTSDLNKTPSYFRKISLILEYTNALISHKRNWESYKDGQKIF